MLRNFLLVCLIILIHINSIEATEVSSKQNSRTSNDIVLTSAIGTENTSSNNNGGQQSQDIEQKDFYGKWKISKVVAYNRVNAGEEVARKWLGEEILFMEQQASVDQDILKNPDYKESNLSENDFFQFSGYISFSSLGINGTFIKKVIVYDKETNCVWENAWGRFYIKDRDTLLKGSEGVWFEVTRIK
jgi:hypothetical protein